MSNQKNSLKISKRFLLSLLVLPSLFLSGCAAAIPATLTFMGADVPFWLAIAILIVTAILKPTVFKWVLAGFSIWMIILFTDITMVQMFWVGIVVFIIYLITKKK